MKTNFQLKVLPAIALLGFGVLLLALQASGCKRIMDYREKYEGDFRFHIILDSVANGDTTFQSARDYDGHVYVSETRKMLVIHYTESVILEMEVDKDGVLSRFAPLGKRQVTGAFIDRNQLILVVNEYIALLEAPSTYGRYTVTGERR
jgi:hypothetical protein